MKNSPYNEGDIKTAMKRAMKCCLSSAVLCFSIFALQHPSNAKSNVFENKNWSAPKIDASIQREYLSIPVKPASFDFHSERQTVVIGRENGTRFYSRWYDTTLDRSTESRIFLTRVNMDETGFVISSRFHALPHQSVYYDFGDRSTTNPFLYDQTFNAQTGIWNPPDFGGFRPVNAVYRRIGTRWTHGRFAYDLSFLRDRIELDTGAGFNAITRVNSLDVEYSRKNLTAGLLYAQYPSWKIHGPYPTAYNHGNTHIEARMRWQPMTWLRLSLAAGLYRKGLPTAGGIFSDAGSQFAFQYFANDPDALAIYRAYTSRIGYYSVGIGFVFNTK